MANSSIIGKIKNKIVRDLINDPDIVAAIDCQIDGVEDNEDLINRVIFDFNQNPYTLIYDNSLIPSIRRRVSLCSCSLIKSNPTLSI